MRFIKNITVDCDTMDFEYAKKLEDAVDYFSELCTNEDIKCEKTCPFYSLCGEKSNNIISIFTKYIENHVE